MKFIKLKPNQTTVDHRYQRELDVKRAQKMSEGFSIELVGVPVVSKRDDGTYVRIDGQHRLAAMVAAGLGDIAIEMQVFEGLTLQQESELFLRLNGGRKAVGAIDKYKARIEARDPVALEIHGILKKHGCRVGFGRGKGLISAVQAVEYAYHKGNLNRVVYVLGSWMDRDSAGFDGSFIRGVSLFLATYPDADTDLLIRKLSTASPKPLLRKMQNESRQSTPTQGAVYVLLEIYNHKIARQRRLPGLAQQTVSQQASAPN